MKRSDPKTLISTDNGASWAGGFVAGFFEIGVGQKGHDTAGQNVENRHAHPTSLNRTTLVRVKWLLDHKHGPRRAGRLTEPGLATSADAEPLAHSQ